MSSPAAPPTTRPKFDRWFVAFVAAGFVALLASCVVLVTRYSNRVPERDDLELVFLFQKEITFPYALARLWAPLNEHRIFLSELVRYGLVSLTHDFRSAAWFQLAVVATLAATCMFVARRLRGGRTSPFDLVFPLVWLTWGNAENFMLGVQVCLTLAVALACTALFAATWRAEPPGAWRVSIVGVCALLLPNCGGFGVCQAPAWLAWLVIVGVSLVRTPGDARRRRAGWLAFAWVLLAVGMIAFYFYDLALPNNGTENKSLLHAFGIAGEFLSLFFGAAAYEKPYLTIGASVLLVTAGLALAVRAFVRDPAERTRALGFGAAISGTLLLGLSIGWSRQDAWPIAGWAGRYVTAATPGFAAACLALVLYAPRFASTLSLAGLSAVCLSTMQSNIAIGGAWAKERHDLVDAFTRSAQAGTEIAELARTYGLELYVAVTDFEARVLMLEAAKLPPYDRGRVTSIGEGQLGVYLTENDLVESPMPALLRRVDKLPVLAVRAPGRVQLALPPGARRMSGVVGVLPIAYSRFVPKEERTRGLRVSVEHITSNGERTLLFQRVLDPENVPADRTTVPFRVALDEGADGEIVLRCDSLYPDSEGPDWAAWSFVPPR